MPTHDMKRQSILFFVKNYIAYSIYMPKILHIVLRYCNNARIHVLDYTI